MIGILKYIQNGISITGNPNVGYVVFTELTQHFKITSLDELTSDRFEIETKKQINFEKTQDELLKTHIPIHQWVDFQGYINGKYDSK